MKRYVFLCSTCRVPVTGPLAELPEGVVPSMADGQPPFDRGFFSEEEPGWSGIHSFLVNLADLRNVAHHWEYRRLIGCCGVGDCGLPNLVCREGHEVGIKVSD